MNKKWRKALSFAGLMILGGVVGFGTAKIFVHPSGTGPSAPLAYKLALIPALAFCFFLVIAVHELGHVLAGRLVGFRFQALTVGPLMWEREAGRIRFRWNRNLNAYGGLALCIPPDSHRLVARFIGFTAGGPLASVLLALAGGLGYRYGVPAGPSFANYVLEFFWLMCLTLSALIALITLVPMRSGGFLSDGARMLQLLRGGPKAFVDVVCLRVIAQSFSGTRPRDIDPQPLLEAVAQPLSSHFTVYLHGFLYLHYLDKGLVEKAGEHLDHYTSGVAEVPKGYQSVIYLENVWFEALYRKDAAAARKYWEQVVAGAFIPKTQVHRAAAALAFAEGDHSGAVKKVEEALLELPRSMDKGAAVAEREWLEQLLEAITQKLQMTETHRNQPA